MSYPHQYTSQNHKYNNFYFNIHITKCISYKNNVICWVHYAVILTNVNAHNYNPKNLSVRYDIQTPYNSKVTALMQEPKDA